jgi:hypothetical protein
MSEFTEPDVDVDAATPLDLLDATRYISKDDRNTRLGICKGCDRLFKPTGTCKQCGCFMGLKTWIDRATCPLGKW